MLFLAEAAIHRGQFKSSNFIADFGCSTESLADFHKELYETKSILFQFRVVWNVLWAYVTKTFQKLFMYKTETSVLPFIFKYSILDVLTTLSTWK